MFKCKPVELDFIDKAPLRFESVTEVEATPEQVFEILADADSWRKWFTGMSSVSWLTESPFGVGSRRQVVLASLVRVEETFLVWEPGKRFCFRFENQNVPLADSAIEDVRLEALPGNRCRVSYTVYMKLPSPLTPIAVLLKPVLGTIFKQGTVGLEKHIKKMKG